MRIVILHLAIFLSLASCNMEKEIDLDLPEYQSKVVVECYLEPGKPYRATLFESVSYFEPPQLPEVLGAVVTITYNNVTDTLDYSPYIDPADGKYYNYRSSTIVPADYVNDFYLEIKEPKGRMVTGRAIIPIPVVIDTVKFFYTDDSTDVAPYTEFIDPNNGITNYFRYVVTDGGSLSDEQKVAYQLDDNISSTSTIAVGSGFNFNREDSVIVTVFHLSKEYFTYLNSIEAAIDGNGNPFGQPASILSNVTGGLGIFAGLSYDRKYLKVP